MKTKWISYLEDTAWIISTNGGHNNADGFVFASSDVPCPVDATGWKVLDGSKWSSAGAVLVTKALCWKCANKHISIDFFYEKKRYA